MISSVADLRNARTVDRTWVDDQYPTNTIAGRYSVWAASSSAASPSGESPTSYGDLSALDSSGIITRILSDRPNGGMWNYLFDLLWIGQDISTAALGDVAVNSIPFPPRDVDGSSNGRGLVIMAYGRAVGQGYVTFTNSDGVTGRTASTTQTGGNDKNFVFLSFTSPGDAGVRSIESFTVTTTAPYTLRLAVMRPIGRFAGVRGGQPVDAGVRASATPYNRLHAGTVLVNGQQGYATGGAFTYLRADIALDA